MNNHAEKKVARAYAAEHGINYQKALGVLRDKTAAEAVYPVAGSGHLRPGQNPLDVQVNICERQADGSLFYSEYVAENWLSLRVTGFYLWSLTSPLIDAIPHLAESITARLRDEVPEVYAEAMDTYGGLAEIGSPPHPDDLSDRELLERWLTHDLHDEVYSDGDLVEPLGDPDRFAEPMTAEYANPFEACVVREFTGLSEGCGGSLSAGAVLPGNTPLDESVLHSRLVDRTPDWGRFLGVVGPWHLGRSPEVLSAGPGW